jgi:hypothetical protein
VRLTSTDDFSHHFTYWCKRNKGQSVYGEPRVKVSSIFVKPLGARASLESGISRWELRIPVFRCSLRWSVHHLAHFGDCCVGVRRVGAAETTSKCKTRLDTVFVKPSIVDIQAFSGCLVDCASYAYDWSQTSDRLACAKRAYTLDMRDVRRQTLLLELFGLWRNG